LVVVAVVVVVVVVVVDVTVVVVVVVVSLKYARNRRAYQMKIRYASEAKKDSENDADHEFLIKYLDVVVEDLIFLVGKHVVIGQRVQTKPDLKSFLMD